MIEYFSSPNGGREIPSCYLLLGPHDLTAEWDRVLRREPCKGKVHFTFN